MRMKYKKHIYAVGEIIKSHNGSLEIVVLTRTPYKNTTIRSYRYKCLVCGFIGEMSEYNLKKKQGCSACHGLSIHIGFNDINTTNKELGKLLLNPEEAFLYTQNSNHKTNWKCPDCGGILENKSFSYINSKGFHCKFCGRSGISYPERFVNNVLNSIGITFNTHKKFKWSDGRYYDIYLKKYNTIIEIMGAQHTSKTFESIGGRTLEEEIKNDKYKKDLAKNNGITRYIVIDAAKSDCNYIKNNIISSELNGLFNLSNVEWELCHQNSLKNIIKESWVLWDNGENIKSIAKKLNMSTSGITKYLKIGFNLNQCTYNSIEQQNHHRKLMHKNNKVKCVCLNSDEIFDSIDSAAKHYQIDASSIASNCNNKRLSAGKDESGNPLLWMYYKDYVLCDKNAVEDKLNNITRTRYKKKFKKVVCLTNHLIFDSLKDASKYCGLKKSSSIILCCNEQANYAGVDPINGEKLRWQYYDDYLSMSGGEIYAS